jgi:hypothetical protein
MRYGVALALLVAGCYSPKVVNSGFHCVETDNPACPDGQRCVAGFCTNAVGGAPPPVQPRDLASTPDDLASRPSDDLARSVSDMAKDTPPPDLSMPPDLATAGCWATGTPCDHTNYSKCCSHFCYWSTTNTCK